MAYECVLLLKIQEPLYILILEYFACAFLHIFLKVEYRFYQF